MSAKKKKFLVKLSLFEGEHKKRRGDEFNFNRKKEEQKGALLLEGERKKIYSFCLGEKRRRI